MINWSFKSCGYRLACGGIVIGFVQYAVGFGLPTWTRDAVMMSGLWQNCTSAMTSCHFQPSREHQGWFDSVRALASLGMVGYCMCILMLYQLNCNRSYRYAVKCDQLGLPVMCICTGAFGLSGSIVYAVFQSREHATFSSGLYLTILGSTCCLLCGIVLVHQRPDIYDDEYDDGDETTSIDGPIIFHSTISASFPNHPTMRARETDLFY